MIIKKLSVGPIIGWCREDYVRLWGRGQRLKSSKARVFGVAELRQGNSASKIVCFKMKGDFDATGIAEFDGLKAHRKFKYRMGYVLADLDLPTMQIAAENGDLQWEDPDWIEGKLASQPNREVSLVFGTCRYLSRLKLADKRGDKTFRAILDEIDNRPTDLLLMLGDQIYGDDFSGLDPDEKVTEYWKKYRNAFGLPMIRKLMSKVPTYMMLDDHEIINNWNADMLDKCETDEDHSRCRMFKSAMEAYHSYQFIHGPGFSFPSNKSDASIPKSLYYSFSTGKADFFVMDTRTERSPSAQRIISVAQMKKLKAWLSDGSGRVKFVGTSVPVFPEPKKVSDDKWGGYPQQRDELLHFIFDNSIPKVVFLSGDIHSSGCATLVRSDKPNQMIHQIISSPFWWPLSPGNSSYFRKGLIKQQSGQPFNVTYARYFTDDDNYTRVTTQGGNLVVECKGRKGKSLGSVTLKL